MAKIITADGVEKEIVPKNATEFKLSELQGVVGGFIEVIRLPKIESFLVLNEEGKICHPPLPLNRKATEIFRDEYPNTQDYIVGNVLICKYEELN